MSDENERSVASAGSVAERPLGDPEVAVEILRLRVAELEEAIRRLAEQDALLSVLCKRDGSQVVTVTMDGTLTDEERELLMKIGPSPDPLASYWVAFSPDQRKVAYGLLERLK